jgi:hypothetical protein
LRTVLRRIFGPKREKVEGGWRRLYNEELHYLYASPNIVSVIKSRRMRWAGHLARMDEVRNAYRILVGKPYGKRPLRRSWRRWGIVLEWIVRKYVRKMWIGFMWPRIRTSDEMM